MERHRINIPPRGVIWNPQFSSYLDSIPGLIQWPIQDQSPSTTALAKYNGNFDSTYDGTHSGVTLGQPFGGNIPYAGSYVPASSSYTDIYSAALASVWVGNEYTIMIFSQANPGMLIDGQVRYSYIIRSDANNQTYIARTVTDNEFRFANTAGGQVKEQIIQIPSAADTTYFAVTNSLSAGASGEIKVFINSVQQGATLTGLGTWANPLSSTETLIGARSTAATQVYWGLQSSMLIHLTRAMTPAEITDISNRSGI